MSSNFRPVSLTCLASKPMESISRDVTVKHLLENDLCTTWLEDVDKKLKKTKIIAIKSFLRMY